MKKILLITFVSLWSVLTVCAKGGNVKFFIFTDLHHQLVYDAPQRLNALLQRAVEHKVDFVVQLGDMVYVDSSAHLLSDVWKASPLPIYSVLGNHDMERNDKAAALALVGARDAVGFFDYGSFRFVRLDTNFFIDEQGNEMDYDNSNWYRYSKTNENLSEHQVRYLDSLMRADPSKTIVLLSHAPIDGGKSVDRQLYQEVRDLLERSSRRSYAFSGHLHLDYDTTKNNVTYVGMNSASYFWNSSRQSRHGFTEEQYRRRPVLHNVHLYDRPLGAVVTIYRKSGKVTIEGVEGQMVGDSTPSPQASIRSRTIR